MSINKNKSYIRFLFNEQLQMYTTQICVDIENKKIMINDSFEAACFDQYQTLNYFPKDCLIIY